MNPLRFLFALIYLLALTLSPAFAREKEKKSDSEKTESDRSKDDKNKEEEEPKLSVTEHTINIGGKPVKYKATAGYIGTEAIPAEAG